MNRAMKTATRVILILVLFVWLGAEAGLFPHGPKPYIPSTIGSGIKSENSAQKRDVEDINTKLFRNSWVVEFNDLITSAEEFAQDHDVHVMRIGEMNLYSVRSRHATYGRDAEKESKLSLDPRVRSIEFQIPQPRVLRQIPTTDPGLCNQWHMFECPNEAPASNINIQPAWTKGFTGLGIQIAIVDDGVQYTHPDLADAYVSADSYDFADDDADPAPDIASSNYHGTACTGLAVAPTNTYCGVGSAYKAKFSALRLVTGYQTPDMEASALSYKSQNNHIYSNSWGPRDDGKTIASPGPLTRNVLASTTGRGGKGSIFVFAGGNARESNDQTNKDGYVSNPNVICVAATDYNGTFAPYSEPGASVFIAAPGGSSPGLYTTDIVGTDGFSLTDCNSEFTGTSAAAPVAAGAIAVVLEANPNLNARDVRRVIGLTARKNDLGQIDKPWFRNGANHWVSYNYGFGLIDIDKAVEAAKIWTNLPAIQVTPSVTSSVNEAIGASKCYPFSFDQAVTVEYISLTVSITHPSRGDLAIELKSPSGTQVYLLWSNIEDVNSDIEFTFYSYFFLDENASGTWTACFMDLDQASNVGTLNSFSFGLQGRPLEPAPVFNATLVGTSKGYLGDMVNVTITFSNANGLFSYVRPEAIQVGSVLPSAVKVVSSNTTSFTAVFTIDTSKPNFGVGSFDINTTEISVQDRMLKSMPNGVKIGTLDLVSKLPMAAPGANGPTSVTPSAENTPTKAPVKAPTGRVSTMSSNSVFDVVLVLCASILYVLV